VCCSMLQCVEVCCRAFCVFCVCVVGYVDVFCVRDSVLQCMQCVEVC